MVTASDFERFTGYYDEAKQSIDARLTEVIDMKEDIEDKRRLLEMSVRGGKRVRPVLTLLVADVLDAPYDRALDHAVIVELIHTASLVADDRFDNDDMRRGAPALWRILEKVPFSRVGEKVTTGMTIMAENGLMALALELADDPDVVEAMGRGTRHLVDGFFSEGAELSFGITSGGYDRYIEVNKAKTGGLFSMATWMPATYIDSPPDVEEAARLYGMDIGVLYQVADDIADGDLPSFIDSPADELQSWYDSAVSRIAAFPDSGQDELLRVAPAWTVWKMFQQEGVGLDVPFLPEGVE